MEKVASKERDMSVDIAKGAAILCVVAGHASFPLTLWVNVYSFHMAFFFIIAGFFISLNNGYFKFILSKFLRLTVPFYAYFFFCAVVCLLFCKEKLPQDFFSVRILLQDPFDRNGTFPLIHPLWFVNALFGGMVLFAVFHRAFAKLSGGISWVLKIVLLMITGQLVVEAQTFLNANSPWLPLFRGVIAACLLGIGYIGWREREKWNNSTVCFVAAYIFLGILWRFTPNYVMAQHTYDSGFAKHLFMLCSVCGFIAVFGVCKTIERIPVLSDFLLLCGKNSFTLMALHMSVFELIPERLVIDLLGTWFSKSLLFAAGVIVPLAIGILTDRLRRLKTPVKKFLCPGISE